MFPQSVVPAIIKLTGSHSSKSWFLALYQDGPWQWVVVVLMGALGLSMYAYGGLTYYAKKRALGV
ncbi:hypothetical protein WB401_46375, partial [Streptomyces brasiliscabiei]|uniref:hypothetical protein n=1 Tax=Streptomyces brasiliscabiei TaxID=2736302 RepID=UPI003015530A